MRVARAFVAERYLDSGGACTLRHWRGEFWEWRGPCWVEREQRASSAALYSWLEHAVWEDERGEQHEWSPNRRKVADVLDALAAVTHLDSRVPMPTWVDGRDGDGVLVACTNGLLDLTTRTLLPHDPRFFNATSVPFRYEPAAAVPRRWLSFLADLWPEDEASPAALQEWFGYVASGRLDLHRILLLVGPTRAGKGVIARVLIALIGRENLAGPTLSSLGGEFGLAPLLGKSLAVVSDARLNGRSEVVVERLLSISGEDALTVNRKYRDQWTGTLPARLMICSNELPQLGDASMAVAGRFVPLILSRSWLGQEDRELEPALHAELPGILNWALDGLERLTRNGRFTRSPHADEALDALQDLASPVTAFVRDRCLVGGEHEVEVDRLYNTWRAWAVDNGHERSSKQVFGRDLRAAIPGLYMKRPRDGDSRPRVYVGVGQRGRS
jgi:putative DNA primase/helicase